MLNNCVCINFVHNNSRSQNAHRFFYIMKSYKKRNKIGRKLHLR